MTRLATPFFAATGSVLLLLGLCAPPAAARLLQDAHAEADDAQAMEQARAALADVSVDDLELPMYAATLLQGGDLDSLRQFLASGRDDVTRAILAAINSARYVGLVDELLQLAARPDSQPVRRSALDNLQRMGCSDPKLRAKLLARLDRADPPEPAPDPGTEVGTGAGTRVGTGGEPDPGSEVASAKAPESIQVAIIQVLGGCHDLQSVDVLISQLGLGGARADAAGEALSRLSGFAPPDPTDPAVWRAFWERNRGRSREELLDLALQREGERFRAEEERLRGTIRTLRGEVEQSRIERLGQEVDRLVQGLSDEYRKVREEAARRLAQHAVPEQAATALPALLERLGHAASPAGTESNGQASQVESDPQVRVALILAASELGRGNPEVRAALVEELSSEQPAEVRAAVSALGKVRDSPAVVQPLLTLLDRFELEPESLQTVYRIIAANQPTGVLAKLEQHLAGAPTPAVRAEVAKALLACSEVDQALDLVQGLVEPSAHADVRFSLAEALGDRARGLSEQPQAKARMLDLLARLAADPSPSVRAEAASSLGDSGDPTALAVLEGRVPVETDPTVTLRLVRALGKLRDPGGVDTIGRLCAGRGPTDPLWLEAKTALLVLVGEMDAPGLWSVAQTLADVGADQLAIVILEQIIAPTRPTPGVAAELVPRALGLKAELLLGSGQMQAAHDLLTAIHAQPQAAYPELRRRLDMLATACDALGLFEEEAGHLQDLLAQLPEGDPGQASVPRRLARALWNAGLDERALVEVQSLYDASPESNELMLWLAQVHERLGHDDLARDLFTRLLPRLTESDLESRVQVQESLARLGPAPTPPETEPVPQGAPADEGAAADGEPPQGEGDDGNQDDDAEQGGGEAGGGAEAGGGGGGMRA